MDDLQRRRRQPALARNGTLADVAERWQLCTIQATLTGGFWTAEGKIVFGASAPVPQHQVPANGGTATPISAQTETRKLMPLVKTQFNERGIRFSSDGKHRNGS
jgi:hypothetical protein